MNSSKLCKIRKFPDFFLTRITFSFPSVFLCKWEPCIIQCYPDPSPDFLILVPRICTSYGSFPPTETDLDSDSNPYCYIVLCTTFSTGSDSDSDPCTDSFLNGYCTHFRDGSPSQGSEYESVSVGGNEPLSK